MPHDDPPMIDDRHTWPTASATDPNGAPTPPKATRTHRGEVAKTCWFKRGDRVRVSSHATGLDTDAGQVGTVLEDSDAPWICFDKPTRYPGVPYPGLGTDGRRGYYDCISGSFLEPEEPAGGDLGRLGDLLEAWSVLEPGMWENDDGPEGWYAVSNGDGIVAYFSEESAACRYRLAEVNRALNG